MRRPPASVVAAIAGWCGIVAPSSASAWTCGGTEPPGFVLPPPHILAPRNVRPIVRLLAGDATAPCAAPLCAIDVESLELRAAPTRSRAPRSIPIDVSEARAGDVATFAVAPRALLDGRSRYEIVAILRARGDRPAGTRRLVGSFRTNDTLDRTAPTWTGTSSLELIPFQPPASIGGSKRGTIRISMDAQPLRTYAEVWGKPAIDLETPPDIVTYAVRVADANGVIDRAKMPRGFFRGEVDVEPGMRQPHLFWLGQANICYAHTFDFPQSGSMKVGVTAVDLAGNESPMFEHTIDLGAK